MSVVPLSPLARRIIDAVPIIDSTRPFHSDDLVFDAGWGALEGAGKTKDRLDARRRPLMAREHPSSASRAGESTARRTRVMIMRGATVPQLLDHLVGAGEDRWRDRQAESLRGF